MSKKARSEAKLKRIAFKNSSRVLAVYCGFCLDENGRVDRRKKLGWLTFYRAELGTLSFMWRAVSLTPPYIEDRLVCPKCNRYLSLEDEVQDGLTEVFLARNRQDKRTTLLAIASELAAIDAMPIEVDESLRLEDNESFKKHVSRIKESRVSEL